MTGILPGMEAHAGRDLALGQWDTHPELARAFVRWCEIGGKRVLEPSCGIGNIALAAKTVGGARNVVGVEIDPARAELAVQRAPTTLAMLVRDVFDHDLNILLGDGEGFDAAIGNPPFENNGALRHALRWLDFAPHAYFIAPLETIAGQRDGLWDRLKLVRMSVCAPGRPPFGLGGNGMSEIAFFEVVRKGFWDCDDHPSEIDRVDWRAMGAP